ncbi:MAG TPA: prolyl oligopeptidase family serine peptidase [Usitatibacter sp.]|nr:prolyl oligopeptidase family serine peptidase [Usitatibacter sp.]
MIRGRRLLAAFALAALPSLAQLPEEDLRGLEDASRPSTQAFFRAQGERARAALDALPGRAALLARVQALSESTATLTSLQATGPRVFYLKRAPGQQVAALCTRERIAAPERVLVDPSRRAGGREPGAIAWFRASPDGRHVAYGISEGAGGVTVLHVVGIDGNELPVAIDRTRFNEALEWSPDGRSFFYARIPESNPPGMRYANARLYRHVLGRESAKDEIVFAPGVGGARDVPGEARPSIYIPPDSRYAYAVVREGLRRELDVHATELRDLAAGKPRWRKIAGHSDAVLAIEGWRDDLFLLTHRGASRHRILRMHGGGEIQGARVAVPEGESVIEAMALAKDALYLQTMVGGIDRLERVGIGFLGGLHAAEYVRTPFDTSIAQVVASPHATGVLLRVQGWIEPPVILQVDAQGDARDTHLIPASGADYSGMDEVRLYAPAADGARIPVTLIYKKGTTLTGQHPTVVAAYGSYGVSMKPAFDPLRLAWLERGGIYAVAHVRGGGEFGETWYESGRGAAKANTISDFIAACDFLVRYGFTNPRKLGILGSGAGGIPVGMAITRRPELFAAAVARAPLADMLRYEAMAGGLASVAEFGSASTAEGTENLKAISTLQRVKDGDAYPGVMLDARMGDWRVEPWQAAKLAARLQAASASGRPVLLRMEGGEGRRAEEDEVADIDSFLLWQMGDAAFQPPGAPVPAAPAAASAPTPAPIPESVVLPGQPLARPDIPPAPATPTPSPTGAPPTEPPSPFRAPPPPATPGIDTSPPKQ